MGEVLPEEESYSADLWYVPLATFGLELLVFVWFYMSVIKNDAQSSFLNVLEFLIVPAIAAAGWTFDGVIISINSYTLGHHSTLFCSMANVLSIAISPVRLCAIAP